MNLTKILAAVLLVIAIALAIGAWVLSRPSSSPARPLAATATAQPASQAAAQQHAVLVLAKAVAAGQRLTAEDVKLTQLPLAVAHSFASPEAVVGRTTVIALSENAPLFEQHLLNGLAVQLESGQRALSVAVKEPMAAGHHVRPGDFVDVFFTLDAKTEQASLDTQTRLLLARSRVLAYGAASVENPPPSAAQRKAQQEQEAAESGSSGRRSGNRETQGARADSASTAVLAVPLEDVERLTLAEKYGQLTLALRHPDDMSVPDASLFAALPTVLQPVAGRLRKDEKLQGADRSFAGLRFKDLAAGAQSHAPRRTPAATPLARPAAGAKTTAARPQAVELYQGSTAQTASY